MKTLSGSFPIFALPDHTILSQTQTGATAPLTKSNATAHSAEIITVFYYTAS